MGCSGGSKDSQNETICLYKGHIIEFERRPGSLQCLHSELKDKIGKESYDVSAVQAGSMLSIDTENAWTSLSDTNRNKRLVLVIQPETVEETMSLEMTGKRKRDRKYTLVNRKMDQLKKVIEGVDEDLNAWWAMCTQPDLSSALILTFYNAPDAIEFSAKFPYFVSSETDQIQSEVWRRWIRVVQQIESLDQVIEATAQQIEAVVNKRQIKRLGLFKKGAIDSSTAKAQENNVKLSMTKEILSTYTSNVVAIKTALGKLAASLEAKLRKRPALKRYRNAVARYMTLSYETPSKTPRSKPRSNTC